jgi:hypothetical protein
MNTSFTSANKDPLVAAANAVLTEKTSFQTNRNVVNAEENLKRIRASFDLHNPLLKVVSAEVGADAKKSFIKINKHLDEIEDLWGDLVDELFAPF